MIKLFKVVHNNHRNKFLVEWNKPDEQLSQGWCELSDFVLVCEKVETKSGFQSICRNSNTIGKGDIMQEANTVNQSDYDDNAINKWRVFAVCDYQYEIDFALIAYADGQAKRLEIKQTLLENK